MKSLLLLASALVLTAGVASAQTVLPSGAVAPTGAVAPSGAIITPGTVPGSQPVAAPSGGSPRARHRDQQAPGMTHQDRKRLRKMGKVKFDANSSKQSGKN